MTGLFVLLGLPPGGRTALASLCWARTWRAAFRGVMPAGARSGAVTRQATMARRPAAVRRLFVSLF